MGEPGGASGLTDTASNNPGRYCVYACGTKYTVLTESL
jgi:hypothetical protein